MDDMVKRVGRAIWLKLSGPELDECQEAARAAIEAMREPTENMLIAGVACTAANMSGQDIPFPKLWGHVIDAAIT